MFFFFLNFCAKDFSGLAVSARPRGFHTRFPASPTLILGRSMFISCDPNLRVPRSQIHDLARTRGGSARSPYPISHSDSNEGFGEGTNDGTPIRCCSMMVGEVRLSNDRRGEAMVNEHW